MGSGKKKKLLKAKIAVALHDELGRVPKTEEIDQVFLMARVMYKAVLGLHLALYDDKNNTIDEICKTLNISRATLYRYIKIESDTPATKG